MRFVFSLAASLVVLSAAAAYAMPLGGLSYNLGSGGPGFSIASGVGFMQRDVHVILDDKIVDQATSSRWMVKLDIGPIPYIDVYGLIGAADFKLTDAKYRGNLATVYGGGLRPQLFPLWFYKTKLNIAADLQYAAYTTTDEIEGQKIEARYQEGQVALIISYQLKGIVPFCGLKYNPFRVDITGSKNNLTGDMDTGVFIGTDYYVTPNVFFTGELSIFSETSIFLMVGYNYPPQH